ncbi:S41 family peptidase [Asaia spathodeae]|uniref:Tail specific protease domain-containing protein n=1 Tax=Asaia spathodeae TaxID=657016 RepID=A0ABX2P8H0_9PROT|nr:S41 family peptidase [Asaia spathodeae]
MRLLLPIALSLLTSTASAAAPFDRKAWQQDYSQLKSELVDRYANLAWKASDAGGIDLPALDRNTEAAVASASDDTQAADAIRAFIAGFHDGHLSELPYLAVATTPSVEPGRHVLDPAAPIKGCAALGYASTGSVAFSLPLEGLPGFKLILDGLGSTFRAGTITRSGVMLGIIRIQNFRARAFPAACLHAWADLRQAGRAITRDSVHGAAELRWFQDMAAEIRTLRHTGATALVVDIGNDSGGDDSGDWTPRLFTERPVRSARLLMADASDAGRYFADEIRDINEALAATQSHDAKAALTDARSFFSQQTAAIGEHRCDLSWVWREQRAWSPTNCNRLLSAGYAGGYSAGLARSALGDSKAAAALSSASTVQSFFGSWTGPTYVLADQRSYSSAEMFAAVMQDNRIAKLVGNRTGGDGCGFMTKSDPIILRHSRLRFRVPNCMRLRAEGTNEEAGIVPDISVPPTEGESERARAERALLAIINDLAGASRKPH